MTIVFSSMLVIHAILHLIGFSQAFNLGYTSRFKYRYDWLNAPSVKKVIGTGWLLACAGLLATSYFYFTDNETLFVTAGMPSLILSQTLIIFYWSEAKFGTLLNSVLLLAIIIAFISPPTV